MRKKQYKISQFRVVYGGDGYYCEGPDNRRWSVDSRMHGDQEIADLVDELNAAQRREECRIVL